jgi:hypothetical protein
VPQSNTTSALAQALSPQFGQVYALFPPQGMEIGVAGVGVEELVEV